MVKRLPAMWETRVRSLGWEDLLEKERQPTPVLLPGESHGQRSLVGYSPRGCKESDTTERHNQDLHSWGACNPEMLSGTKESPQIPCSFCQNLVRKSGQAGNNHVCHICPTSVKYTKQATALVPAPSRPADGDKGRDPSSHLTGTRQCSAPGQSLEARPTLSEPLLCSNQAAWPPRQWLCSCTDCRRSPALTPGICPSHLPTVQQLSRGRSLALILTL